MITFIYCSKEEGEVYILTRVKTNAHSFASISKLRSDWIISCHIMLTSQEPSWFHVMKAINKVHFGYYRSI